MTAWDLLERTMAMNGTWRSTFVASVAFGKMLATTETDKENGNATISNGK